MTGNCPIPSCWMGNSARQIKKKLAAVLGWFPKVQLTTKIMLAWNFDLISAPKPSLKIPFLAIFRLSPRVCYHNNSALESIIRLHRTFPFDYNSLILVVEHDCMVSPTNFKLLS